MTNNFQEFRNDTTLNFKDITSESWREYIFLDNFLVRVEKPIALNVSKTGGHRIFDADGVCHYIPSGWRHLKWKVKDGEPHFVL